MSAGCLGCVRCESGPVATLIDGRTVCTWCPDWRRECEARVVLGMAGIEARRAYLAQVERRRGKDETDALAVVIRELWDHRKATVSNPQQPEVDSFEKRN